MSNIIEFKLKKPSDDFKRIDELFSVTMWLGTNDEYEIDMFSNEDYDDEDIFIALQCLYAKFGIEHGFIDEGFLDESNE